MSNLEYPPREENDEQIDSSAEDLPLNKASDHSEKGSSDKRSNDAKKAEQLRRDLTSNPDKGSKTKNPDEHGHAEHVENKISGRIISGSKTAGISFIGGFLYALKAGWDKAIGSKDSGGGGSKKSSGGHGGGHGGGGHH